MVQSSASVFLERLKYAPFPHEGKPAGRQDDFHRDNSVLFFLPPSFNPEKPFFHLIFFHGFQTTVVQTVSTFELDDQVAESNQNVIFIAPQLAVNLPDSSPGKFLKKNIFSLFMAECVQVLSARIGPDHARKLTQAPIILCAFSGGYKSVAYILERGGLNPRIRGVLLFDACYGELKKFKSWIGRHLSEAFFLLLYTQGPVKENALALAGYMAEIGLVPERQWPDEIRPGRAYLIQTHQDHLTVPLSGPPERPLKKALQSLHDPSLYFWPA
ncbi:MAG: hypothetical protein Q8P24_06455 [Desulfobacterales bacterium]|nr:hypothetical protein [Desulfobacterales bacterium]